MVLLTITRGGNRIAVLSEATASRLGVRSSGSIKLVCGKKEMIAIANIGEHYPDDSIGFFEETYSIQIPELINRLLLALPSIFPSIP